ncbi:MAG: chromate resistance protein ChrB domain-containing protein [Thermomicrobiales bacterium]
MKWVTRANVKVDRVACPWLITNFVDPQAEFIFVPPDEIPAVVEAQGAIPYDASGVELGHHGAECSFDAILKKYNLPDKALHKLALIVRGADTADKDLTPESRGLEAVAEGFRRMAQAGGYDDHETNRREWIVYDALYLFCGGDTTKITRP